MTTIHQNNSSDMLLPEHCGAGYPTPVICMTRTVNFSAAFLYTGNETEPNIDKNNTEFENPKDLETSGHNYTLDVSVTGYVDTATGIVVNIKDIDRIVRREVVEAMEGRLLNGPLGPMQGKPVSCATLVTHIHNRLQCKFPPNAELTGLRLEETPTCFAEWSLMTSDNRSVSVVVTRAYEFSASHRLHSSILSDEENRTLFGKCNYDNGHGHNYILEVSVGGEIDPVTGTLVDQNALDEVVHREVVDRYDHRHLNLDIPEFADVIPSSELLTYVIWERLKNHIPGTAHLSKVVIRETARNVFEYSGKD